MPDAYILGIESSCDETGAAVVRSGQQILSNVVASQIATHQPYGGVVPELASREHLRAIVPVVRQALIEAEQSYESVDAIAVTQGPGLAGALLVGISFARALAFALDKPLIALNHLEGHIHAVLLEQRLSGEGELNFPVLALVVSGGHTHLYLAEERENLWTYRNIGHTRDDAAGEAYDKVAKLLGLGYPGGPILDRLAAVPNGAAAPVKFSPTKTRGNPLDFSFSGLKTAVLYHVREHPEYSAEIRTREEALLRGERKFEQLLPLCSQQTLALVREFQNAVVRDLVDRTMMAAEELAVESVLVSGGVAANSQLRMTFEGRAKHKGIEVFFPSRALSTDNAAMIAAAAYERFRAGVFGDASLNADPSLILA